jgi:Ca2+-binding RTX toxin-like protein
VGTYTVVASFAGSADYNPAAASITFTISAGNQGTPTAFIGAADFGGDASGVRGQYRNFVVSAKDSSGNVPANATYTINWGDGHIQTVSGPGAGTAVGHAWIDTGTDTIQVTVTLNGSTSQAVTRSIAIKVIDYQLVQTDVVTGATAWALVVGGSTHSNILEIENDAGPHLLDLEIENGATGQYEIHQAVADNGNGTAVGRIILYGQSSHVLMIAPSVTINGELHASDKGGSILQGGGGNDILIGGAGTDILSGGSGRDLMIGGMGSDLMIAGKGDDIMIAGTTIYNHNDLALRSILTEWTSADNYATRVSNIMGQTHAGLEHGAGRQRLRSPDRGTGHDWFFANVTGQGGAADVILGVTRNDTVTNN